LVNTSKQKPRIGFDRDGTLKNGFHSSYQREGGLVMAVKKDAKKMVAKVVKKEKAVAKKIVKKAAAEKKAVAKKAVSTVKALKKKISK
jgi:hypothetical protein